MSKIYDKYLELKEQNKEKLYLFHSGKFYIFIADDVNKINEYVVLKPTKFTKEINKCGFPDSSYEDYMRVFNNHNLDIEVVDTNIIDSNFNSNIEKYNKIRNYLKGLDINSITPLESLEILNNVMRCIND